MGLHLGEPDQRDGDYFGPVVNTTARVAAVGHGGQVLFTEPVRVAAEIDGLDLGEHTLRDVGPVRIFQIGDAVFPALRSVDRAVSSLPVMRSSLIGRDAELVEVGGLLTQHRLVTVTGVGGCGKTRLVVELMARETAGSSSCSSSIWHPSTTTKQCRTRSRRVSWSRCTTTRWTRSRP